MKKITLLLSLLITTLAGAQTVPTITCPMDITNPVLGASCDAIVNFNLPTANDTEDGMLLVTQTQGLPSGSSFPLGATLQEFTAEDSEGNIVNCQFTITVVDTQNPIALCQDTTVFLDENGLGTLDPASVDAGSFDTCGIASIAVSQTDFSCDDLFTSIEESLYISGVFDGPLFGGAPKVLELYVAEDIPDLSIYGLGSANNGGGTDGQEYTFPADAATAGTYIYIVRNDGFDVFDFFDFFGFFPNYEANFININGNDALELFLNGNVVDVFGEINVNGTGQPWEYLDGWAYRNNNTSPSVTFNVADWTYSGINALDGETTNATATTPFPVGSYTFIPTLAPPTNVTLTVTDTSGNTSTCVSQVTIEDALAPLITFCPGPLSVITDADSCTATNVVLEMVTATDNCSGDLIISNDAPEAFPLGDTTVTWTVTDASGNEATCEQVVTVNDGIIPNVVCQNITVQLDENGTVIVTPEQVDGGSTDNCELASLTLSTTTFTCEDIGTNNVALTATDATGNINACVVTITVEDTLAPEVVCQNIEISLNNDGLATITVDQINNGSQDNCGVDTVTLSQTNFTCENIGENTVILTVTDVNGNENECEAIVTVVDEIAPTAVCQNIEVALDATGQVTIDPSQLDGGSTDNCGIETIEISTNTFTCATIGENEITVTYIDTSGNETSCTAIVTVLDNTMPTLVCQNVELTLNEDGEAILDENEIVTSVMDNCGIDDIELSISTFGCENVGENEVVITAFDFNGNETQCTAIVTVIDPIAPTAVCQNFTVLLDENGMAEITPEQIDGGSTDNCDNVSLELDTTQFNCDDVGQNEVTLFVTDASGNVQDCIAIVTVVDNTVPTVICQNITVELDEDGEASIEAADVDGGSFDNCGIQSLEINVDSFDCSNQGENDVILVVTDNNGNTSQCIATVTVVSVDAPEAICQNISVTLDENGEAILSPLDVYAGNDAPCNLSLSQELFTCEDLGGPVQVTLSSTNSNGDSSTCTAIITVVDNIFPTITCPEEPVIIAAIPLYELPDFIENGTVLFEDNCPSNVTYTQEPEIGTLVDEGETEITIVLTDAGGNEVQCSFVIFVDPSLNVEENSILERITVFPNPANQFITISNKNNVVVINAIMYDITGRIVKQFDLSQMTTEKTLDISELASANYLLEINGTTTSKLIRILKK